MRYAAKEEVKTCIYSATKGVQCHAKPPSDLENDFKKRLSVNAPPLLKKKDKKNGELNYGSYDEMFAAEDIKKSLKRRGGGFPINQRREKGQ